MKKQRRSHTITDVARAIPSETTELQIVDAVTFKYSFFFGLSFPSQKPAFCAKNRAMTADVFTVAFNILEPNAPTSQTLEMSERSLK